MLDKKERLAVVGALLYCGAVVWLFPHVKGPSETEKMMTAAAIIADAKFIQVTNTNICVGFASDKEFSTSFSVDCGKVPKDRLIQLDIATKY
jgi:hypothetical protein